MRYSKLNNFHERRLFDPAKKKDLMEFKYFMEHNRWRGICPFFIEDQWENIPAMCKEKYTQFMLGRMK